MSGFYSSSHCFEPGWATDAPAVEARQEEALPAFHQSANELPAHKSIYLSAGSRAEHREQRRLQNGLGFGVRVR